MQKVMRIGNDFVPVEDDDIEDIGHTCTQINDAAQKYKTDVLAVISKGDTHNLVTQYRQHDTMLVDDLVKVVSLIQSIADTYKINARDIAEMIKVVIKEG